MRASEALRIAALLAVVAVRAPLPALRHRRRCRTRRFARRSTPCLAAVRDRHTTDTVLAASGGMLDSEYSSDDAAPPPETPAPAPPDSSSDDDDAAVPPPAASTEGYIPPQTRKKKVDYGAFSASMTRGAADEFDDYD